MTERILPNERTPALTLPMLDSDEAWRLHDVPSETFTLLVVYRGYHCPLCRKQLEEFNEKLRSFEKLGVEVFAISCDDKTRADKTAQEWDIDDLAVLYDLPLDEARRWGLYVSRAINDDEPGYFAEPGLFLVQPDGTLYAAWIQSVPFSRPPVDDLLKRIKFVLDKDYPPRGVATDEDIRSAA